MIVYATSTRQLRADCERLPDLCFDMGALWIHVIFWWNKSKTYSWSDIFKSSFRTYISCVGRFIFIDVNCLLCTETIQDINYTDSYYYVLAFWALDVENIDLTWIEHNRGTSITRVTESANPSFNPGICTLCSEKTPTYVFDYNSGVSW